MKIGYKKLLLGACLFCVAGIVSCSHKENIKDENSTGDYYLSFTLNTDSGTATRAPEEDKGTLKERKVSDVHILLYETAGSESNLLYRFPIEAKTNGSENFHGGGVAVSNGAAEFISHAVEVDARNYQMVVLVNATSRILDCALPNISKLKDLTNAFSAVPSDFYDSNEENFFMSNAGGIEFISAAKLKKNKEEAVGNPIRIRVERLLAKVYLYEAAGSNELPITQGGKLESLTWSLDATNKQTYLVRRQDRLQNGAQELGYHPLRDQVYAMDPNFTGNKGIIEDSNEKGKHFNYLNPLETTGYLSWIPHDEHSSPGNRYHYVLENTVSREDQNTTETNPHDYITQVLVKAVITGPGTLGTTVTDYYSYTYKDAGNNTKWVVFTHEQAVEWNKGTYPADMTILKTDKVFKQAQDMPDSPFNFETTTGAPGKYISTDFGLTWHKGGLNVYRIPIQHFGTSGSSKNDYGYFGIVRNNIYKIIITKINGPGTNTEDEGYLSTFIEINKWEPRDWEEDDLDPER